MGSFQGPPLMMIFFLSMVQKDNSFVTFLSCFEAMEQGRNLKLLFALNQRTDSTDISQVILLNILVISFSKKSQLFEWNEKHSHK